MEIEHHQCDPRPWENLVITTHEQGKGKDEASRFVLTREDMRDDAKWEKRPKSGAHPSDSDWCLISLGLGGHVHLTRASNRGHSYCPCQCGPSTLTHVARHGSGLGFHQHHHHHLPIRPHPTRSNFHALPLSELDLLPFPN